MPCWGALLVLALTASPATAGYWKVIKAINCGDGLTHGDFEGDNSYSGGSTYMIGAPISGGTAPEAVYQCIRRSTGGFTYTIEGLYPGTYPENVKYTVKLHFAQGQEGHQQDVRINGQLVLNDYSVYAEAGSFLDAVVETFNDVAADAQGEIGLKFTTVAGRAIVSGIEILEETVDFGDSHLEAAVEAALGVSDPTASEMLALADLNAQSRNIGSLTGIK